MIRRDEYRPGAGWRVWAVVLVLAASVGFSLIRIKTLLGVEAPVWDKTGRDAIWRIWWRARDDFMPGDPPQFLVTAGLAILLGLFIVGLLMATWSALSPEPGPPVEPE
ncbi:MAG: hypothetical protein M3Y37_04750 [Chloroflexota bacterium]|jgi:hypothetical protein|nr:hypothetical protein [Chloroflexota bacterium]